MTLALVFWILMLLWVIFLFWWHWWPSVPAPAYAIWPLPFVLFFILGWAVFGAAIR
jgi:hypothetical protein